MNVIDIRGFFKRIADNIDLNESEEYVYKLKKTQRIDQYADISLCEYV